MFSDEFSDEAFDGTSLSQVVDSSDGTLLELFLLEGFWLEALLRDLALCRFKL